MVLPACWLAVTQGLRGVASVLFSLNTKCLWCGALYGFSMPFFINCCGRCWKQQGENALCVGIRNDGRIHPCLCQNQVTMAKVFSVCLKIKQWWPNRSVFVSKSSDDVCVKIKWWWQNHSVFVSKSSDDVCVKVKWWWPNRSVFVSKSSDDVCVKILQCYKSKGNLMSGSSFKL